MSESFNELAGQDEGADIAIYVAEALNEIVAMFGPDAIGWIRDGLIEMAPRAFADDHGDTWIECADGTLSMVDAAAGMLQGWPFGSVERMFGPLTQLHGEPLPVVHATSRWQRLLGRLGIRTRAWCGERIVAGRPSGSSRECRECRRALDGETR